VNSLLLVLDKDSLLLVCCGSVTGHFNISYQNTVHVYSVPYDTYTVSIKMAFMSWIINLIVYIQ